MPEHKISINLDNLRLQAVRNVDRLIDIFDAAYKERSGNDDLIIAVEDVEELINDIKSGVGMFCCVYIDGVENFTDLSHKVQEKWFETE